jgi:hypothetical protein
VPSAALTPSTALTWSSTAAGIGSRTSPFWFWPKVALVRTATSVPWVTVLNRSLKVLFMVSVST